MFAGGTRLGFSHICRSLVAHNTPRNGYKSSISVDKLYRYRLGDDQSIADDVSSISTNQFRKTEEKKQPEELQQEPQFSGEIPIEELQLSYSRSGGKGGQHVNKVNTKVDIRFNVVKSNWIPDWIKPQLMENEKNRINKDGFLIIQSDKTRKQILNQADCLTRLRAMIFEASRKPKEATPEEIALAEKRQARRAAGILREKRHNSLKKQSRGSL